jgi:hypothetical protein
MSFVPADVFDRVGERDRRFFERHPGRRYLLRRAYPGEMEIIPESLPPLPPGGCWWIVVSQIEPGIRARQFLIGPRNGENDLDDNGVLRVLAMFNRGAA